MEKPFTRSAPVLSDARIDDRRAVAHIAEVMLSTVLEMQAALTPVLGSSAVAALSRRSIALCGVGHPWLAAGELAGTQVLDLDALRAAFLRQGAAAAAAGSADLIQAFRSTLVKAVGPATTQVLLQSVWKRTFMG